MTGDTLRARQGAPDIGTATSCLAGLAGRRQVARVAVYRVAYHVANQRLEGDVFFGTLLARCPGLRLAGERVEFVDNFNMRQVKALPVAWTVAQQSGLRPSPRAS